MRPVVRVLAVSFFSLIFLNGFFFKLKDPAEEILGRIPVQSGGRVKPFESFAREALLSVTGKRALEGRQASGVVWDWIARPEDWYAKSFLSVKYAPLREDFSQGLIEGRVSPELVLTYPPFQEKVKEATGRQERKELLAPIERKSSELYDQARLFQAIAQGSLPGLFPDPENSEAGWIPVAGLADPQSRALLESRYPPSELAVVQASLARLLQALRGGEETNRPEAAREFSRSLEHLLESRDIVLDQAKIGAEIFYNRARPFQWACALYLAGALVWGFLRKRLPAFPLILFGLGFMAHSMGFVLRCQIAGRPPVTNMYESIIWVAWAAVLFSAVLGLVYRKSVLPAAAAWVAAFALLIGESFPAVLDPSLSPLVPVLRNNYWLTIHVLTITLSYGAFALAWGIAHADLMSFAFHPERSEEQDRLGKYLYRALQIGVVLLAAGTILGGVWANDSWGRFWGWDPKETWALIALFGYLAVLHGRFAGWLGTFGTALGSVLAFLGVLMAWYGVNFVLAAGFHSYGFGGGGLPYVLVAVLVDLAFVSFLAFRYNKFRRSFTNESA